MNRNEYLQQCKDRANEYLDIGDTVNAFKSFMSDMTKHEETRGHPMLGPSMILMLMNELKTVDEMRKFINRFS